MSYSRFLSLALLGCLCAPAHADFVSGTVVDANGQPIAGVNIVAKSLTGGGDGGIANAGTNSLGVFFSTINPGTYELTFEPPAPPAAVALVTVVDNVVVSGTAVMGNVMMDPAVHLSGRFVHSGNIPVQGVNLDIIDQATGDNLDLIGDTSNINGEFNLAAPVGPIELRAKTAGVLAPVLAPMSMELDTTVNATLGNIELEPGFTVSAVLVTPSFLGVSNLDVDVVDVTTGKTIYTPGDNTDINGFVDIVLPAGTYDLEFCPPLASSLVALRMPAVSVSAPLNLGLLTLAPGVHLTGTVTSYLGTPVASADIDARDAVSGLKILLCGDNTNAAGQYDVVVPQGTLDLTYTPADAEKLGSGFATGLSVTGNTVQNAVLPFCDCGAARGGGIPGTGGLMPQIAATGGGLRLGSRGWTFQVSQGRGGARGIVAVGFGASCGAGLTATVTPMGGISLVSTRVHAIPFRLDGAVGVAGAGSVDLQFDIPLDLTLTGASLSAQAQVRDPAATSGRALTSVLCGTLCQ